MFRYEMFAQQVNSGNGGNNANTPNEEVYMYPFEAYLKEHNLNPLTVSIVARVRYLTVWNAIRGNPITVEQASKIKVAVISLIGHFYAGPLTVFSEEASIPNHHSHQ